ncbi:asparagine synthetase B [Ktedonobacteria bacterium brp13]|nr:asparagine synthetase B [Ktedonobacteria bacterium brp13]
MPVVAGWLTGEQVSPAVIEQTLQAMEEVLALHGGEPARSTQPGAGLVAFADAAYATPDYKEPPVLDWIPERRTLLYRRPLSGLHPLYYIADWPAPGNLLFASEIKALFAVGVPRRLHLAALDALLRFGFIPAPWTAFQQIAVVPAGSLLRWQHAKLFVNHTTDFRMPELEDRTTPPPPTLDELTAILAQACSCMLPSHEQFAALAGGGPAAALATLLLAQQTRTDFPIATIGSTRTQRTKAWKEVERLAAFCQHSQLAITGSTQPEFWLATLQATETPSIDTRSLALHQLLHTTAAETNARVAFSGLGAQTLLGSQAVRPTGKFGSKQGPQEPLIQRYMRTTVPHKEGAITSTLWSDEARIALHDAEPWETTLHARKLLRQAEQFSQSAQGVHYLDLHLRLPDQLVLPFQQLAQQEQIALRSLYLHKQVMPMLIRNASDSDTATDPLTQLMQHYAPALSTRPARLPLAMPLTLAQQKDTSELVEQVLSREAIQNTGLFQPAIIEQLRQQATQQAPSPTLLLAFTTQLLCQLFQIEGW